MTHTEKHTGPQKWDNYIYTNKLHTSSILLADFVNKISLKYRIEGMEA